MGKNKFFSIFRFIFFLIVNKTDIYHFFLPKSYILGGLLTILSKKKKIMSRRSLNKYHKKYFFISLLIEKILHTHMDLILTNSTAIKDQLVNREGVRNNKIKVIPNFITSLNIKKKKLKNKSKFIKFGYVANFIPYKNHLNLLSICSKIDTNKKWKLLLVGSDVNGYRNIVKKEIFKLGLSENVLLIDPKREIDKFYNEIDFSVSTSSEEGSSNFLLESIFHGLPIIAFDVGGNKDFFDKNGFLVPACDNSIMKKKIECMLTSKLDKFKENSLKVCKSKFNNKKNLKLYISSYRL